jgi:hypothetical protein
MSASTNTETATDETPAVAGVPDPVDVEPPEPQPPNGDTSTRSMRTVLRAIERHHVRALILEHVIGIVADRFRGNEVRGPKYWLKVPGGGPFVPFHDDVHELELDLRQMASDERTKVAALIASPVTMSPKDVDIERPPYRPFEPVPEDEGVEPVDILREVYGKTRQPRPDGRDVKSSQETPRAQKADPQREATK